MTSAEKQHILQELGGLPESVYDELIGEFHQELPSRVAELRTCASEDRLPAAAKIGHTLKGTAANFRLQELREVAYRIECAAKSGDYEAFLGCVDTLEELSARDSLLG